MTAATALLRPSPAALYPRRLSTAGPVPAAAHPTGLRLTRPLKRPPGSVLGQRADSSAAPSRQETRDAHRGHLHTGRAVLRAAGAGLGDAVMVHTLLRRSEDADDVNEVFDDFFPDVRPPRCVSRLGVERPGILVSIAMVAVVG